MKSLSIPTIGIEQSRSQIVDGGPGPRVKDLLSNHPVLFRDIFANVFGVLQSKSDYFMNNGELEAEVFDGNFLGREAFIIRAKHVMEADASANCISG
jgi:hypothetical protein